jgi:glyceraldehyde 3-phosphate dehydrogenase
MIYPELKGKLNGLAVRVPLLNASLTDCVFEVARETTIEEVNSLLKNASEGELKGILGYEERPLVSIDYKDDPRSSIIDALSTMVVDGTQVKILAWYDNEWGYSCRMAELARKVAVSIKPFTSLSSNGLTFTHNSKPPFNSPLRKGKTRNLIPSPLQGEG